MIHLSSPNSPKAFLDQSYSPPPVPRHPFQNRVSYVTSFMRGKLHERKVVLKDGILIDVKIKSCCFCCCLNVTKEKEAETEGVKAFFKSLASDFGAWAGKAAQYQSDLDGIELLRLDQAHEFVSFARSFLISQKDTQRLAKHIRFYHLSSLSQGFIFAKPKLPSKKDRVFQVRISDGGFEDYSPDKINNTLLHLPTTPPLGDDSRVTVTRKIHQRLCLLNIDYVSPSQVITAIADTLAASEVSITPPPASAMRKLSAQMIQEIEENPFSQLSGEVLTRLYLAVQNSAVQKSEESIRSSQFYIYDKGK